MKEEFINFVHFSDNFNFTCYEYNGYKTELRYDQVTLIGFALSLLLLYVMIADGLQGKRQGKVSVNVTQ